MLEHETVKTLLSELSSGEWHDLSEILRRCGRSDAVREALALLVSDGVARTEGTRSPRYRLHEDLRERFAQWESDIRAHHEEFRTLSEEERRILDLAVRAHRRDPRAVRLVLNDAYMLLQDGPVDWVHAGVARADENLFDEALSDAL